MGPGAVEKLLCFFAAKEGKRKLKGWSKLRERFLQVSCEAAWLLRRCLSDHGPDGDPRLYLCMLVCCKQSTCCFFFSNDDPALPNCISWGPTMMILTHNTMHSQRGPCSERKCQAKTCAHRRSPAAPLATQASPYPAGYRQLLRRARQL